MAKVYWIDLDSLKACCEDCEKKLVAEMEEQVAKRYPGAGTHACHGYELASDERAGNFSCKDIPDDLYEDLDYPHDKENPCPICVNNWCGKCGHLLDDDGECGVCYLNAQREN